jgi:hypothetical protein
MDNEDDIIEGDLEEDDFEEDDDDLEFDECGFIQAATPFDPEEGVYFKYGRIYLKPEEQIAEFEAYFGIKLPDDFLELTGGWCEGGFDGNYKVAEDGFGVVKWNHLLLMKMPDSVDLESDEIFRKAYESVNYQDPPYKSMLVVEIVPANRSLFYSEDRLKYFPFGAAIYYSPDSFIDIDYGFLVFDLSDNYAIRYCSKAEPAGFKIADSFSEMMHQSFFMFYG